MSKQRDLSALREFEALPDDAQARIRIIAAVLDCSESTVLRHEAAGLIPKARRLGRIRSWTAGDFRRPQVDRNS